INAATRSCAESAASDNMPSEWVVLPTLSFSAVMTTAAYTEFSATRRFSVCISCISRCVSGAAMVSIMTESIVSDEDIRFHRSLLTWCHCARYALNARFMLGFWRSPEQITVPWKEVLVKNGLLVVLLL